MDQGQHYSVAAIVVSPEEPFYAAYALLDYNTENILLVGTADRY